MTDQVDIPQVGNDGVVSVDRKGENFRTELDTLTGIRTEFYDKGDGHIYQKRIQDTTPIEKYAKHCRNHGGASDTEVLKHYATIPAIVIDEMYRKGIDVSRDGRAVFEYVNANYPALKVTDKWHDSAKKTTDGKIIVK